MTFSKRTVTVKDQAPATTVAGLHAGVAYDCKVRATSKAGNGAWSAKVTVAKRP